jgi:hypothetical protein
MASVRSKFLRTKRKINADIKDATEPKDRRDADQAFDQSETIDPIVEAATKKAVKTP